MTMVHRIINAMSILSIVRAIRTEVDGLVAGGIDVGKRLDALDAGQSALRSQIAEVLSVLGSTPTSGPIARGFLAVFTKEGKQIMSDATVSVDSTGLIATLAFVDDKGNSAQPAAPPVWTSSDVTIATITAAADGMTAEVDLPGKSGKATLSVTAEGDPTPGVDSITLTAPITVTAGEIKGGAIAFSPVPAPTTTQPPFNPSNVGGRSR